MVSILTGAEREGYRALRIDKSGKRSDNVAEIKEMEQERPHGQQPQRKQVSEAFDGPEVTEDAVSTPNRKAQKARPRTKVLTSPSAAFREPISYCVIPVKEEERRVVVLP